MVNAHYQDFTTFVKHMVIIRVYQTQDCFIMLVILVLLCICLIIKFKNPFIEKQVSSPHAFKTSNWDKMCIRM